MKFRMLLIFFFITTIQAQNKQNIMQSGQYYYGSGISFDAAEAKDLALEELTAQIAVRVAHSFKRKIIESGNNLQDNVKSVIETHSAATLQNVKTLKSPAAGGRIEVFCYLAKNEVTKIFNERRKLIHVLYKEAKKYEAEANYAYALKLYYFARLLMNSIPDQNIEYEGLNFTTLIPQQINRILLNTSFSLIKDQKISPKEREITLRVEQNGQAAAKLDFTFWDGANQTLVESRDGLATFQLYGSSVSFKELRLMIKYAYYEARGEYAAVKELWPVVDKPLFDVSKTISLSKKPQPVVQNPGAQKWNLQLSSKTDIAVAAEINNAVHQFLENISGNKRSQIRRQYKNDPFLRDKILRYLDYNHPRPLDNNINAKINKTESGYELRRIRMQHNYPSIHKTSTEYLTLDFSEKGELLDLNLSISDNLYENFVKKSKFTGDWKKRRQIIKFIEKYRTAYLTRDIKTVDMMFSEDALILIGRRIERRKLPDNSLNYRRFSKEPEYKTIKLNKTKYIERQRAVFKAQKDIFLDYASFAIDKKSNAQNVYGVEMRQNYSSTGYADEGYLFLLIDFSDRDPLIYVRAWQPQQWSDSALVRTANFRIYK